MGQVTIVPIVKMKRYPELFISRGLHNSVWKQGLIEPILVQDIAAEILEPIPQYQEISEAFIRIAEVEGITDIIVTSYQGSHR